MKIGARAVAILLTLAVVTWVAYKFLLPEAFVAAERGSLGDARLVTVASTTSAPSALDFRGNTVSAGLEDKYVLIDVRIDAPAGEFDFDDFQLVKEKAPYLGEEQNVGDHTDPDYFYWSFLDASGNPLPEAPTSQRPFRARVAFKVPKAAGSGYLFYKGSYWGPLAFATP